MARPNLPPHADPSPNGLETTAAATSSADVGDVVAQARPGVPAGLRLVHARVASALFGPGVGGLGRFRVLERLGAGGMGVVYAAYDPDLDRGVALKLVRVTGDRGRALAEAKALARLSHPNVVPVYDVGIDADHVYIVMELVRGETLRGWQRGRAARDIAAAYRQAGDALAAAHAAGLVHRDFKPENAIVGGDGRVRVLDFGLACEASSDNAGTIAGTPRYMAPEQARGDAVTPAADQYSFCIALAEALAADDAPVPRWLAAPLERGAAAAPGDRFPSMSELLRALGRDPARVRRQRIGGALVVALGAVAFVAGRATLDRPAACSTGAAELASAWPTSRSEALARLAQLGPYGRALAPWLDGALDDHARRWTTAHRDACVAHRDGAETAAMSDRRAACLARGRSAIAEVAALVTTATDDTLPELALAASAVPDPAACGDLAALAADTEPPPPAAAPAVARIRDRLEHARIQVAAGRVVEAAALAGRLTDEARAAAYPPALAEALLVAGHAAMITDQRDRAVPALDEATVLAFEAGATATGLEAWARRAWLEGTAGAPAALAGAEVVEALAKRSPSRFARALLYNNLGSVALAQERRADARRWLERALAEARGLRGAGAVELVVIRSNLAIVTDDRQQKDALLAGAEAELIGLLGPDHPQVLWTQHMRATSSVHDLAAAAALLTPVCQRTADHPGLDALAVRCWTELALVRWDLGDRAGALTAMERAGSHGDAAPEMLEVAPYVALWRGDAPAAVRGFEHALAALPPAPDEGWPTRFKRAELSLGLGRALGERGDVDGARRALRDAIAALGPIAERHLGSMIERRLVAARAELAALR